MTIQLATREARTVFSLRFGGEPAAVSWAPGRVELLGNHTDYNGGLILAVALDLGISVAMAPSDESPRRLTAYSTTMESPAEASLEPIGRSSTRWINYPLGVLDELAKSGVELRSLRMTVASSLPLGAGVSSSAAIELATAQAAFEILGGRPDEPFDEVKLCQRAEVSFVGMPCGLLDQFSSRFGKKDHALFLDCSDLSWSTAPLGDEVALIVADTQVKHALVDGEYATLRAHCESAARRAGELLDRPVRWLRDLTLDDFLEVAEGIDPDARRRAEHVLRENERVLAGRTALEQGNVGQLGKLLLESHESSRDLFGNSCGELDAVIEKAREIDGFLGGKLSGGGFGGATVLLVRRAAAGDFVQRLATAYDGLFEKPLRIFTTRAGVGAHTLGR